MPREANFHLNLSFHWSEYLLSWEQKTNHELVVHMNYLVTKPWLWERILGLCVLRWLSSLSKPLCMIQMVENMNELHVFVRRAICEGRSDVEALVIQQWAYLLSLSLGQLGFSLRPQTPALMNLQCSSEVREEMIPWGGLHDDTPLQDAAHSLLAQLLQHLKVG